MLSTESASRLANPKVLVLMGVSGCGKTTVGRALAKRLGWQFEEGDSLHPRANINKVAAWIEARLDAGECGIITCSALKRAYRDRLDHRGREIVFVYLAGSERMFAARIAGRHGHFMPVSLLPSQFADLEEPGPDEPAIRVDIGPAPEVIVQHILDELVLGG